MTALLLEAPATTRAAAPVRTLGARPARATQARSCAGVSRPHLRLVTGGAAAGDAPLYWTRRGLAVAIALVALVVLGAVATLVTAFLAVSDAPLPAGRAPVAAVAQVAPGR